VAGEDVVGVRARASDPPGETHGSATLPRAGSLAIGGPTSSMALPHPLRRYLACSHRVARSLITAAALVLAVACWVGGNQPVIADSSGYLAIGRAIATKGPEGAVDAVRPYAYPLFLAVVVKLVGTDVPTVHRGVWVLQVAAILLTAALTSRRLGTVMGSQTFATVHYALIALNPLLHMLATDILTDVIAALLVYGAVVATLGCSGQSHLARLRDVAVSAFLAGLAFETRPSAMLIVAVVALLWSVRAIWCRDVPWPSPFIGAVAVAIPIVPQVALNYTFFKIPSPTVLATGLYEPGVIWGLHFLRSASVMIDGRVTLLLSFNPFRPADVASVDEFMAASPLGLAATFALHGLGLIDHTLGFAYAQEIEFWYRWPLALWSYALLVLGLGGAVAAWKAKRRHVVLAFVASILGVGASAAPYLPMVVDPRYGLPLFLFFAIGTTYAIIAWWTLVQERRLDRAGRWLAAFLLVMVGCAGLSHWYDMQTPMLASHPRVKVAPDFMNAGIVAEPPRLWRAGETQQFPVTLTNQGAMIWFSTARFLVYLKSEIVRTDDPTVVVASAERVKLPRNLQPGGSVMLTVVQPAPAEAGCYVLRQQVFSETWMKLPQEHVQTIAVVPSATAPGSAPAACE